MWSTYARRWCHKAAAWKWRRRHSGLALLAWRTATLRGITARLAVAAAAVADAHRSARACVRQWGVAARGQRQRRMGLEVQAAQMTAVSWMRKAVRAWRYRVLRRYELPLKVCAEASVPTALTLAPRSRHAQHRNPTR